MKKNTTIKRKIKDLPEDFQLVGCKLKGKYIVSGWNKGFWVKKSLKSSRVYPVHFEDFDEVKDWVIEIDDIRAMGYDELKS